jgi:ABC-type dipeptide/oligopeptide/nickel transport system permease component
MGKRLAGQMKKNTHASPEQVLRQRALARAQGLWRHAITPVVALAAMAAGGLLRWQQSALPETPISNKPFINQMDSWLAWSLR